MYQETIKVYPFYKDSWTIVSDKIAEKQVDRSIFKYGQFVIPKYIVYFFEADNLKPGNKNEINLFHSNKLYSADVTMDITEKIKLSFEKELKDVINTELFFCSRCFIEDDYATDEIKNRPYIRFNKVSENLYKIEFLIR